MIMKKILMLIFICFGFIFSCHKSSDSYYEISSIIFEGNEIFFDCLFDDEVFCKPILNEQDQALANRLAGVDTAEIGGIMYLLVGTTDVLVISKKDVVAWGGYKRIQK
jgi:hypothetical protein